MWAEEGGHDEFIPDAPLTVHSRCATRRPACHFPDLANLAEDPTTTANRSVSSYPGITALTPATSTPNLPRFRPRTVTGVRRPRGISAPISTERSSGFTADRPVIPLSLCPRNSLPPPIPRNTHPYRRPQHAQSHLHSLLIQGRGLLQIPHLRSSMSLLLCREALGPGADTPGSLVTRVFEPPRTPPGALGIAEQTLDHLANKKCLRAGFPRSRQAAFYRTTASPLPMSHPFSQPLLRP